ncbi:hypothetical protein [Bacillus altitudinis]
MRVCSERIVYKGVLRSDEVDGFYLDVEDERFVCGF